jgi:hypothetical protein
MRKVEIYWNLPRFALMKLCQGGFRFLVALIYSELAMLTVRRAK